MSNSEPIGRVSVTNISNGRVPVTGRFIFLWPEAPRPLGGVIIKILQHIEAVVDIENMRYSGSIGPDLKAHLYSLEDGVPHKWLQDYANKHYATPFAIILTVKDESHVDRFFKRSEDIMDKRVMDRLRDHFDFTIGMSPYDQVKDVLGQVIGDKEEFKLEPVVKPPKKEFFRDMIKKAKELKDKIPKIVIK